MQKLDRLGWAAGLALTSFGVRVGLRTTDAAVLPGMEATLPPGWKPSSSPLVPHLFSLVEGGARSSARVGTSPRRLWVLYEGGVRVARHRDLENVLRGLESCVRLTVAEEAPRRVFVHAGAVGWKGRAIVVPGKSFSGKTTLVSELVKAGATYYSDEYAVLDGRGRVHPFPAPLSVRAPGSFQGEKRPLDAPGATIGGRPLPVGLVVAARFSEGARWRPRRLSAAEGALEMLANAVAARKRPEAVMSAIRAAMSDAMILKGKRGEAADTAARLLEEAERGAGTG